MSICIFYNSRKFCLQEDIDINEDRDIWGVFSGFLHSNEGHFLLPCKEPDNCLRRIKKKLIHHRGAGGIVINSEGHLLMIERFGKFDLPKGHIEKNEEKSEAAIREVTEECGIQPSSVEKELPPSYHIFKKADQFVLKEVFWFLMYYHDNEKPLPQVSEQIISADWYTKKAVRKNRDNTYDNLKVYLDYFLTNY